jgi:hypothetical protein
VQVEIPEILNIVQGDTLGQKMEKITACMNTISFMVIKLCKDMECGRIIVDDEEHQRVRGIIDEQYERWEDCFLAVLQTGVGDVLRDTKFWDDFEQSATEAHRSIVQLIREEHVRRELKGVDET